MSEKTTRPWGYVSCPKKEPPRPALATGLPELEERVCLCPCGRKFKVLPSSPLQYASQRCEINLKQAERDKKLVSKVLKRPLIQEEDPTWKDL